VSSKKVLYREASLIIKVKEPEGADLTLLNARHLLFCYLHLAAHPKLLTILVKKKVTAVGFELVEENDGSFPCLFPMSEIAGRVAAQLGAFHLGTDRGGAGILLGGASGVAAARVVVLGAGTVGRNAAMVAIGMGAQVFVYDRDVAKAKQLAGELKAEVVPFSSASLQGVLEGAIWSSVRYWSTAASPPN